MSAETCPADTEFLWEAQRYRAPQMAHAILGPEIEKGPHMPRLHAHTKQRNLGLIFCMRNGRLDAAPTNAAGERLQLWTQIQHAGFGNLRVVGRKASAEQQSPTEEISVVLGGRTQEDSRRLRGNLLKWLRERGHRAVMLKHYTQDVIEMIGLDENGKPRVLATFPWKVDTLAGIFTALRRANSLATDAAQTESSSLASNGKELKQE